MKKLSLLILFLICTLSLSGQKMEFTFSNISGVKSVYLHDGTTLVQLPAGTNLSSLTGSGMSVKADGENAALTDIVPNPSTRTDYVDGGLNVFYYKGKAYKVRFSVGEYFTAVFFSDAWLGSASSLSKSDFAAFAERITKMGTAEGQSYAFDALPGYTPKADIAFYLGDMNASSSQTPIIHTLGDNYMNIVNKCAVVAGQIEAVGTSSTITEYGLCYGTSANPTTSNTYKAAADLGTADASFGDAFENVFGVYFDNLTGQTTYHVRAYCKYTLSGSSTVYTTYGEDRTFTTPDVSGMTWAWEGGETPSAEVKARIEEAMNGAKEYYNHYCTLYKWAGTCYNSGVQTADCSLRSDGSCYIRFGPGERYQWVGTAQHELSHGYGVGQTSAYAGYPNPFQFKVATLTLRVFLQDMTMLIYHDGMHYWPGGINQREEVTNGTANSKGTYTCKNEEMLKCNAMILNGLAKDGMKTTYGVKGRGDDMPDGFSTGADEDYNWASQRDGVPRKVSQSSNASASDFEDALDAFNQAGIPLILAPGDLDLAKTADSAGKTLNTATFDAVTRSINEAQTHGVENLQRFTNGQSTTAQIQAQPFTFTFKGVRFYNGQRTWFDEPMYNSGTTYRWIVPDAIYSSLQTFVNNHSSETSIWMQHLPMNASDADWYTGKTTYNASRPNNTATSLYNSASKRRTALANLIHSTANAALFSGHEGQYNDNNYNGQFHDYTVASLNQTPCDAYIVLMKAGTGVVEVKQVSFRDYHPYVTQYDDPATEYPSGHDNSVLAGLVQGLESLNTGDSNITGALTTAENAKTTADVANGITALDNAFNEWLDMQGETADVSGLLGANLDFEVTAGSATNDKIHHVEGWNEWINICSSENAYAQYKSDLGSPNGGNTLYLRENWKGNPALESTIQVYKDAVLPSGTYLLQFEIRQPSSYAATSLNYYEVDGIRTYFSGGTSWETKSFQIKVAEPSTFRLSFGFVGTTVGGNHPNEVDVDNITLTWTAVEVPAGKEGMNDEGWTELTALPSDYSKYFFTIWDHTQDLGMVLRQGNRQSADHMSMWYAANLIPAFDKTSLWTFDSNVDGSAEYVIMTNVTDRDHMMQTEYNAAYNYRTHDNGAGNISWGRTILSYSNGKWSVQNGKYPEEGYLGPWEPGDFSETALNKSGNNVGYFDIYSILRGQYVAQYELLEKATETNPIDITYCLENPGGERLSTIGWKTDGESWWTQSNSEFNGKVGSHYIERWAQNGCGTTDIYQEIYGLPDGTYRFSAVTRCTRDCYLYANGVTAAMETTGSGKRTEVIVTINNGTLRVGAKSGTNPGSWIAFDDARLEYLGYMVLDETSATPPAEANGVTVKLIRSVVPKSSGESDNAWNTICLPFSLTNGQIEDVFGPNTIVKQLAGVVTNGEMSTLTFSKVTSIQANRPYIMQLDKGGKQYIIKNINITPSENLIQTVGDVQFVGNYVYPCVMANEGGTDYYILNDKFKSSTGRTKIKGFRAYFHVPESSGIKVLNFSIGDITSIDGLEMNAALPADIYNVSGQLVRRQATSTDDLPSGIFIINGRKVIIRKQ